MESTDKTAEQSTARPLSKERILALYMEEVLTKEHVPTSVFKFCKNHGLSEQEFYSHFGSLDGLQTEIWNSFFEQTIALLQKEENYGDFSHREKMLSFFYTFFELLTLNRSYVLFALREHPRKLASIRQLKGLRTRIKDYAAAMIREKNEIQNIKLLKSPVSVFSEGTWLQTVFLLNFWMDDNSTAFVNTDVAIEKSVRAIFDLFDSSPLESIVDFGKFLWKEKTV